MTDLSAETFREFVKSLGAYWVRNLDQFGAGAGVPGITYYSETCAVYERYEPELWALLEQMAEENGIKTGSRALGYLVWATGQHDIASDVQFRNMVVWLCAERMALQLVVEHDLPDDEEEGDDDDTDR